MARVLFIVLLLALTIYALADWIARSRKWTPGRLNRWVWLAVIVIIPIVGPLAWIISGLVTRAEERQRARRPHPRQPDLFRAPDDDPNRVADLADRIARRQKRSRPQFHWDEDGTPHPDNSGPEGNAAGADSTGQGDGTAKDDDRSADRSEPKKDGPAEATDEDEPNRPNADEPDAPSSRADEANSGKSNRDNGDNDATGPGL